MSDPNALVVDGLHVRFGKAVVLQRVDLRVGAGEVVGLAGRNGAGKTTLLRAISGVVHRHSGMIKFAGGALPERPDIVARAGVLHVPEGRGLFHGLSVRDNLRVACAAVGLPFGEDVWRQTVESFPVLEPFEHKHAGLLSGGQQQMVAIARGLAARAKLLMVDELSLGLSPKLAADALAILLAQARKRGTSLLIVDQNVPSLLAACTRTYFLDHGHATEWDANGGESWESKIFA